jgi:hypothetical protein
MKKKVTKTTEEIEEEVEKNPIPALIKKYLRDDIEFPPELANLQYIIKISKLGKDGQYVPVHGRVYDSLETIGYDLASRFGDSNFRLFITAMDGEEKVAFVRVEPFPTSWDGEQEITEEEPDPKAEEAQRFTLQLQMQREKQEHEKRLKEMDNQKELLIAAMNSKGGGGMKFNDFTQMLDVATRLVSGRPALQEETGPVEGDEFSQLINGPLGKIIEAIALKVIQNPPARSPGPVQQPVRSRESEIVTIPQPIPEETTRS